MSVPTDSLRKPESTAARTYVHAVTNAHAHRTRLRAVLRFEDRFGDLGAWNALPVSARMAAPDIVRALPSRPSSSRWPSMRSMLCNHHRNGAPIWPNVNP